MKIALILQKLTPQQEGNRGRATWENISRIGPMESSPHLLMCEMMRAGWDSKVLHSDHRVERIFVQEQGEEEHSFVEA